MISSHEKILPKVSCPSNGLIVRELSGELLKQEIAATLISFDRHSEWQSKEVKIRPKSGSMLLYSRKKVRYRRDGYCWKKRKDGKTTREDHMKLKVQGTECIYGCYVHSAILPTFHRRCYWLLQNPDIVLVHYLNVPYPDDNKLAVITPNLALWADKKEWTKEELISQLKPMFFSEEEPDLNNELEISTAETVEAIVGQLMEKQRVARQAALVKQLECGCADSTCVDGKSCLQPTRRQTNRPGLANSRPPSRQDNNQVSSTTGSGPLQSNMQPHRVYSRDLRGPQVVQRTTHTTNTANAPPLVLSLSQIQGGGGLLILNSNSSNHNQNIQNAVPVANFSLNNNQRHFKNGQVMTKQEAMDTFCRRETKMEVSDNLQHSMLDMNRQHQEVVMTSAPPTPTKRVNAERDEFKRQGYENIVVVDSELRDSQIKKADNPSSINGYFNETLDLSQEDIQRTLSANMPLCSADLNHQQRHRPEKINMNNCPSQNQNVEHHSSSPQINPMDFINNCDVVGSLLTPLTTTCLSTWMPLIC
ncbi:hypothetical protein WA026_014871 [Henosepilachna vigintioctopunctata]|uniref:CG-1 domain-containing protein n=1 Tax=Henosepilachna vigintioctopunctata TaxID=420089 RepID=A0AAW1UYZ5_9CUCU